MSLQKSSHNGHLLKQSGGHLAKECCCGAGGGDGVCDCSPALDFTYTVTLYGFALASDPKYAGMDGDWDIEWISGCTWRGCFQDTLDPTQYFRITMSVYSELCPQWWQVFFAITNSTCHSTVGWILWWRVIATAPDCGSPCTVRPPGSDYAWAAGADLSGNADEDGVVSCSVA